MTHPAEGKREQIARAIYAVSCRWIAPNFPKGHKLQTFDELDDRERRLNLEYADAALALLSQGASATTPSPAESMPWTAEMQRAAEKAAFYNPRNFEGIYRAICAALPREESKQP